MTSSVKPTLLLVDDAPENLTVLAGVLGEAYQVKVATSGAKTLRICEGNPLPDLILLDVMMPVMDGLEVCRQLKSDTRTRDIPVIFVTAMSDAQDEAHGLQVGAVDYITKPISPAVVLQRVRLHLELRGARQALERLGRHYQSYISVEVASSIRRGEVSTGIISRKRPLTVMFSDIVGFTEQTERMHPGAMTELLNGYFEAMAAIVARHQGTLDKFIGDACMVFFGDPTTRGEEQDAVACVQMALEMQAALAALQGPWVAMSGGTPLRVRIGIASGPCTVGNFGSKQQLTYTAIGTTVNLASRLEGKALPGSVLVSEETYRLVHRHFYCEPMGPTTVKGLDHPLNTFIVTGSRPQVSVAVRQP